MNYRSIQDLNRDIRQWMLRLPGDLDLVAGIPRSGMLAANILALHMHLPFTDIEGLLQGRTLKTGPRFQISTDNFLDTPRKILLLDDCVFTGKQIQQARSQVEAANLGHEVLYGGVYVEPQTANLVDCACKILPWPHSFEWNIMHSWTLQNSCVDIDGVLCGDPTAEEDDDGPSYEKFIRNAKPYARFTRKIGWLVTCRLEKYRKQTEEWLARNGIEYSHLIMLDLPSKTARLRARCDASYKAEVYRSTNASLFIESSPYLSAAIAKMAGRIVYCMESAEMYYPGMLSRFRISNARVVWRKALTNPRDAFGKIMRKAGSALYRVKPLSGK